MDNYPDLPTRDDMIARLMDDWTSEPDATTLLDGYAARVRAEHRDATSHTDSDDCCHCGIPGKHPTSDHKAEQPKRCPSVAPSAEAERCALDAGHHSPIHRCDDTEWTG